jgi:DNA-directed RNA polymerase subunit M/transcription elongation factor TFIIS
MEDESINDEAFGQVASLKTTNEKLRFQTVFCTIDELSQDDLMTYIAELPDIRSAFSNEKFKFNFVQELLRKCTTEENVNRHEVVNMLKTIIYLRDNLRGNNQLTDLYNRISKHVKSTLSSKDRDKNKIDLYVILEMCKPKFELFLYDEFEEQERREISNMEEPPSVEEGLFTCRKCNSKKTQSYSVQLRRSDEPATIFIQCMKCGSNWRE